MCDNREKDRLINTHKSIIIWIPLGFQTTGLRKILTFCFLFRGLDRALSVSILINQVLVADVIC